MPRLIIPVLISLLTISCSGNTSPCISGTGDDQDIIPITVDDFKSQPEIYYGKFVKIVGMCVGIGKHGGTTMYIVGRDPAFEIKVTAGEDVVNFSRYCEGRRLEIYGCVRGDGYIYTESKQKNSADLPKKNNPYSRSKYYIECSRYKRIEDKSK